MDTATPPNPPETTGRAANGQFTQGNPGGAGNPYARQVARLRKLLLDRLTDEQLAAIADKFIALAQEGDVPATRLLFSYTLGQPAQAVPPDHVDVHEWNGFKETAGMSGELPGIIATPEPSFALELVRAARPGVARGLKRQLHETLCAGEAREQRRQQKREQRRQRQRERRAARRNSRQPAPAAATDPDVQHQLEALAAHDAQALSALSASDTGCPAVAQALPSPNRCNGAPVPEGAKTSPAGAKAPAGGVFARFWPFPQRG